MTIRTAVLAAASLCLCAVPQARAATADISPDELISCAQGPAASGALCISQALEPCDAVVPETPAVAALCYAQAREVFEADFPAALEAVTAKEGEATGAEARIVVKYEVLTRALLCERDMELLALEGAPEDEITRRQARCMALVTGDIWLRLRLTTAPRPKP
ncbi:hypothetical protein [Vannielia litorea]|uniref:hypothetical protein n=1 Tax=Vannielia litorea TaxID=1217970 RepID=UPI001C959719|nr:hypothetical protein [Vannielia litorea]MBY6050012.1 hypothetical protein [Vannielia litorea]MBY6077426.1 hypothetical protein [Vannielia litorea]